MIETTIHDMTKFSDNLKRLMKERGVSARVLSQATGIPQSTLSEWSAGREPKLGDQVVKLARFFGVSLEYLVTGEIAEATIVKDLVDSLTDEFTTIHQGTYRLKIEKLQNSPKKGRKE